MKLGRVLSLSVLSLASGVACAATVPKAELDRCTLGLADGNDSLVTRQGAACTLVARRLAADEQPQAALGYARKACDLEDARGCEEYLALARGQPDLSPEALERARSAGEKACAGMVLAIDGATDARPSICARTAELYQDVAPRSAEDAGRLFARACKLGDDPSCGHARALGIDPSDHVVLGPRAGPNSGARPHPLPTPVLRPAAGGSPATPPSCHEMRACVALGVEQHNVSEVVGSIANHCERAVSCTWCAARQTLVDTKSCQTATLAPGEARAGRSAGLWYEGFDSIAYDCMDARDAPGCLAL